MSCRLGGRHAGFGRLYVSPGAHGNPPGTRGADRSNLPDLVLPGAGGIRVLVELYRLPVWYSTEVTDPGALAGELDRKGVAEEVPGIVSGLDLLEARVVVLEIQGVPRYAGGIPGRVGQVHVREVDVGTVGRGIRYGDAAGGG